MQFQISDTNLYFYTVCYDTDLKPYSNAYFNNGALSSENQSLSVKPGYYIAGILGDYTGTFPVYWACQLMKVDNISYNSPISINFIPPNNALDANDVLLLPNTSPINLYTLRNITDYVNSSNYPDCITLGADSPYPICVYKEVLQYYKKYYSNKTIRVALWIIIIIMFVLIFAFAILQLGYQLYVKHRNKEIFKN